MALYSRQWTRQPPGSARIDTSNAIADGLYSALLPSAGPVDIADGYVPFSVAGSMPSHQTGHFGVGYKFDGASCFYRSTKTENNGYDATQFVIFEPARLTHDEVLVGMDDSGFGRNYVFFVASQGGDPFWAGVRSDTNSTGNASSGASNAAVGRPQTLAGQYVSNSQRSIWIDGVKKSTNSTSLASTLTPDFVSYGAGYKSSAPSGPTTGVIYFSAQWTRTLSDDEIVSLSGNPWQLFAPRRIWVPQAAITGLPTLSLPTYTPGSLTATGFRPRVTAT